MLRWIHISETDRSNEPPEPLSAKDQREAAEVIEVFGLPLVSYFSISRPLMFKLYPTEYFTINTHSDDWIASNKIFYQFRTPVLFMYLHAERCTKYWTWYLGLIESWSSYFLIMYFSRRLQHTLKTGVIAREPWRRSMNGCTSCLLMRQRLLGTCFMHLLLLSIAHSKTTFSR